ncbi:hypothetical protein [Microcoleus sp. K4-B3]
MDGNNLRFLVTASLNSKFAQNVEDKIGKFPRDINQLSILATADKYLIFYEQFNSFKLKKEQLKERGTKYPPMLAGWAYYLFLKLLNSLLDHPKI